MATQSGDDHKVIVPMGASKTPKYRYQARAAQTLKEIREASHHSTVELAAMLQSRTGKLVTIAELEEWQSGEKDFPAWIIPAMIDISGTRQDHGPWTDKRPQLRSRLKMIGLAVVAGGLIGVATFAVASRVLPTAGHLDPPKGTAQAMDQATPTPSAPTATPTQAPTVPSSAPPSPAPSPGAASLSGAPVVITPPPTARPQTPAAGPAAAPARTQPPSAAPAATPAPTQTSTSTPTATPTPAPSPSATPTSGGLLGGLVGGLLGTVGGVLRLLI